MWGEGSEKAGLTDLTPLKGLALRGVDVHILPLSDLSFLKGTTSLKYLNCVGSLVKDLTPLADCRLEILGCAATRVADLAPLAGMPLHSLDVSRTGVKDLTPLGRITTLADLDLQFHDTVLTFSGYQGLHRIWRSMDGLVRARTYATLALPDRAELIPHTASSHQPIVDAIKSGDPDAVDRAVSHHIHEVPSLMAGRILSEAPS